MGATLQPRNTAVYDYFFFLLSVCAYVSRVCLFVCAALLISLPGTSMQSFLPTHHNERMINGAQLVPTLQGVLCWKRHMTLYTERV